MHRAVQPRSSFENAVTPGGPLELNHGACLYNAETRTALAAKSA